MISVVIATRNRADLLSSAIQSLFSQTLDKNRFETLIIDNGSTDHTKEIVSQYKNQLSNLRYIHAPEPGLHIGRHRGMREAKSDVLVFADDDIEATPAWLESYHRLFSDSQVVMAGGNNFPLFVQPPPDWLKCLWKHSRLENGRALPVLSILHLKGGLRECSPYRVWGCNFAIRKSVLAETGGFHPDGMPRQLIRYRGDGETHVSRYIIENRLKCIFHPEASVYHKVTPERMTHSYFRQRGYGQGISDSYTALRNRDASQRNLIRYVASRVCHKLKNRVFLSVEAREALNEFKKGHREGYAYHQNCYRNDPEIRSWVHKSDYF